MKSAQPSRRWLLIALPLAAALILGIYPVSRPAQQWVERARQAVLDGNQARLAEAYEGLARLEPVGSAYWEKAGLAALGGGQPADAVRLFEEARSQGALSNEGLASLAQACMLVGKPDQALAAWETLAGNGAASPDIYAQMVEAALALGDLERAARHLDGWLTLEPASAGASFQAGMVQAVIAPTNAHAYFLKAVSLDASLTARANRLESGIAAALLESDPAYRLAVIGQSLGAVDQWKLAEAAFSRSAIAEPGYAEAWALLGEARQHLGGDGGEEITKALALNPDSFLAVSLAALRSQRRQEWQDAIGYLEKIASQDPDNPRWQVELGTAWKGLGDLDEAYNRFNRAVELDPADASLWQQLAAFCISANYRLEDAGFPAARQAVQLAPHDPASLDTLAQVYMISGDLASAEKFLERAIASDPAFAFAHLHLGMLYLEQGKGDQARLSLAKAIDLAPDGQAGIQARRILEGGG